MATNDQTDAGLQPTEIGVSPAAPGAEASTGTRIGGYELLGVVGRGGMGVVYKARQPGLNRIVALKMLAPETPLEPAVFARFRLEAQAIAQLQHPNIVQIHEIGEHDGRPFIALEYVWGGSLATFLKATLPSVRQAAALVESLARAIHHAHQRGLVHRDLKPGNILLAVSDQVSAVSDHRPAVRLTADSTLLTALPKITDFGLAKYFDRAAEEALTQSGMVVGTPSYMAPEQASGKGHLLGPATDIYALGAILHELVTGKPPFQGVNAVDILNKVLHDDPLPPRQWRESLPQDVETICLKCLEKDPARRYASAEALAADLERFLNGDTIQAKPARRWERVGRWARQRPGLALGLALGALLGLGLLLGAFWLNGLVVGALIVVGLVAGAGWYGARLRAALDQAQRQHLRAERNAQRLLLLLETANRLMTVKHPDELLRLLSETTTRLLDAERATIFLVDRERNELWSKVALGDNVGEIRVPLGQGIAGAAAAKSETIMLGDPYSDARFNPEVDRRTGYVTRNLLSLPMVGPDGVVVGVFQVLNKRGGAFGQEDVELLAPLAASAAGVVARL